jgi:hypothetical protein
MGDLEGEDMHPEFLQMTLREHERELSRRAQRAALIREQRNEEAVDGGTVVLRLCSVHDDPALDRLALLEEKPLPNGRHVVAEVDGTIVAALPLAGGPALADPFRATGHFLPLLELRRKQLAPHEHSKGYAIRGAVRGWSRA